MPDVPKSNANAEAARARQFGSGFAERHHERSLAHLFVVEPDWSIVDLLLPGAPADAIQPADQLIPLERHTADRAL